MNKRNKLLFTLVALVFAFTSITYSTGTSTVKVNALNSNYFDAQNFNVIYYFSDSSPTFQDFLSTVISPYPVIFDTQYALTSEELEYMLYSGYFWGFNECVDNIVIFELKTMMPDYYVLEEIFKCLKGQNCKIMFISPYYTEYSSIEYIDASMHCNFDKFFAFWKRIVRCTYKETTELPYGTTLFIDGRLIGLYNTTSQYRLADLCRNSKKLRRLLLYLYHSCDSYHDALHELGLYETLWDFYGGDFFYAYTPLNYPNGDTDVNAYMQVWANDFDHFPTSLQQFQSQNSNNYRAAYTDAIAQYYQTLINALRQNDVHIFAHINNDIYIDLINTPVSDEDVDPQTPYIFYMNSYDSTDVPEDYPVDHPADASPYVSAKDLYNTDPTDLTYNFFKERDVYGICYLPHNSNFYDLLDDIQTSVPDTEEYANVMQEVFAWPPEELIFSGTGLMIVSQEQMIAWYGDSTLNGEGEVLESIDQEEEFADLLALLIG